MQEATAPRGSECRAAVGGAVESDPHARVACSHRSALRILQAIARTCPTRRYESYGSGCDRAGARDSCASRDGCCTDRLASCRPRELDWAMRRRRAVALAICGVALSAAAVPVAGLASAPNL